MYYYYLYSQIFTYTIFVVIYYVKNIYTPLQSIQYNSPLSIRTINIVITIENNKKSAKHLSPPLHLSTVQYMNSFDTQFYNIPNVYKSIKHMFGRS